MSWSLRKKRVFFVPFILSEGRLLFNICVLSQCIVYLNALSEYTYFYISIKKHYFIHKIVQVSLITYVHNLTDAHAIFCIFIIFYIYIFIYIYIYTYIYICDSFFISIAINHIVYLENSVKSSVSRCCLVFA